MQGPGTLRATTSKTQQEKQAAEQKAAANAAAAERKQRKAEKALAAEKQKVDKFQATMKHMECPNYWRYSVPTKRVARFPTAYPKANLQSLLRASSAPRHYGDPGAGTSGCRNDPSQKDPRAVVVHHVERVENWTLWQKYTTSKLTMQHQPGGPFPRLDSKANVSRLVHGARVIDPGVNEYWLWHGTDASTADILAQTGFDIRVASRSGLYGAGSYFADAFCKANQYAGTPNARGQHCVLYCRVLVGNAYCTTAHHQNELRPPPLDAGDATKGVYDSIYAEIGVANGGAQKHNEFVVFENGRVVSVASVKIMPFGSLAPVRHDCESH